LGKQQRKKPVPNFISRQRYAFQQNNRSNRVFPAGGIQAETIIAQNVIAGTQVNFDSRAVSLSPRLPLQRPRRADHFVGREIELSQILADLQPGRIITISGPGGIGKTALVSEVIWTVFPTDTPPITFPDGLFYHSFYGQPRVDLAAEQIARTCGEEPMPTPLLAAQRALHGRRALLVLDGAEEADHLEQLLNMCGTCTVIVTSQQRVDVADTTSHMNLRPLPERESMTVLQAWGGKRAADESVVKQICEKVGNLPLALRIAGRYLAHHEEEAYEFLSWLREATFAALDQGKSKHDSVRLLLERSVGKLSADSQQVLALIGLLAFAPFEREIITQALHLSKGAVSKALGELVSYGLMVRLETAYEVSHRLVHTYAREVVLAHYERSNQSKLIVQLLQVFDKMLPVNTYTNKVAWESLRPHIQACAQLIEHYGSAFPEAVPLLGRMGTYLYITAQYVEAETIFKQERAICTLVFGTNHLDTARNLNNLALIHAKQGNYEQAELFFQQSLNIKTQLLGLDHPETANTIENLANVFIHQGKYDQAQPLCQQALDIKRRTLGVNDLVTAGSFLTLAKLYAMQGKYDWAEPLFQQVLAIYTPFLRTGRTDIATGLTNIANFYVIQSKYEQAELLLQQAWDISNRVLGKDHPDTTVSLENLMSLYIRQGKDEQAEALYQEILTIREQSFGTDHPETARVIHNLALIYARQGKYEQAEKLYLQAIDISKRKAGTDHPDTARHLEGLANFYARQDQYELAELLYQQALAIYQQKLGTLHPVTAGCLQNIALLYARQGRYEQAEPLFRQALEINEQMLDTDHPDTATTLEYYALLLQSMQRPNEAADLEQRARSMRSKRQHSYGSQALASGGLPLWGRT
jgi:tetratricopeptide (TPR) repeat protein